MAMSREQFLLLKLAEESAEVAVMTLSATLVFLSEVIRRPVGSLTPDDAIVQDWLEENTAPLFRRETPGRVPAVGGPAHSGKIQT